MTKTRLRWNKREVAATALVCGATVLFTLTACTQATDPVAASVDPESPTFSEPVATPTPTETAAEAPTTALPPCAQEDSDNCYWDAATMGNGQGRSFVSVNGQVYYQDAAPVAEPEPAAEDPATDVWMQPCTDWIADHGGTCKGEPIEWGFSSGDTLVCGQDAKPALDHRSDGIGWWAYCEPALVDQ